MQLNAAEYSRMHPNTSRYFEIHQRSEPQPSLHPALAPTFLSAQGTPFGQSLSLRMPPKPTEITSEALPTMASQGRNHPSTKAQLRLCLWRPSTPEIPWSIVHYVPSQAAACYRRLQAHVRPTWSPSRQPNRFRHLPRRYSYSLRHRHWLRASHRHKDGSCSGSRRHRLVGQWSHSGHLGQRYPSHHGWRRRSSLSDYLSPRHYGKHTSGFISVGVAKCTFLERSPCRQYLICTPRSPAFGSYDEL
jgi:hypothetical protein